MARQRVLEPAGTFSVWTIGSEGNPRTHMGGATERADAVRIACVIATIYRVEVIVKDAEGDEIAFIAQQDA